MDPARAAPTDQQSTANSQQTTPTNSPQGIAPPPPVVSPSSLAQSAASQPPAASSPPPPVPTPTPNPQLTTHSSQLTTLPGHPEIKAGPAASPEIAEIEVIPESPEISPEIAEHLELVKRHEIELPGPIDVGIHEGQQVTITPAAPSQPNIVLPVTQSDFVQGQSQPVTSAWRWLVEWVKRIILKYPGRAIYRAH